MALYKATFKPLEKKPGKRPRTYLREASIIFSARDDEHAQALVKTTLVRIFITTGVDMIPEWYRI